MQSSKNFFRVTFYCVFGPFGIVTHISISPSLIKGYFDILLFLIKILGYSDDLLDLSDLQAEENLAKKQASLTDEYAGAIKSSVENLRKQSLEFKKGFDEKERQYEIETELFQKQYETASEKEKQLALEKINKKFSEYKVSNCMIHCELFDDDNNFFRLSLIT